VLDHQQRRRHQRGDAHRQQPAAAQAGAPLGGRWRAVPAAIASAAEALTAITSTDSGTAGGSRTAPAASTPAPRQDRQTSGAMHATSAWAAAG
jgi:hypothetical protein